MNTVQYVVIKVTTDKPVDELGPKIAGRAYTLQGVVNAEYLNTDEFLAVQGGSDVQLVSTPKS